jgi:DNA-binding response OmpR family regulator
MEGHNRQRVLLVDDSETVQKAGRDLLERSGYDVLVAGEGKAALRELYSHKPDIVILDIVMPGMDGWQTLERIREVSDVPVLMLTALDSEIEKIRGLRGGADDYVVKPFGKGELIARLEALLRRAGPGSEAKEAVEDGFVSIDFAQHRAQAGGKTLELTPLEFRLLAAFVENRNVVLSRTQLLDIVWGDSFAGSGEQVKVYVGYLRRKFELAGVDAPIETVRGVGYRYAPPKG